MWYELIVWQLMNCVAGNELIVWQVCAYNRTVSKVDEFLAGRAKGTKVIGAHSLEEMVATLKSPRRIIMLVKAGAAVDDFINKLVCGNNNCLLVAFLMMFFSYVALFHLLVIRLFSLHRF